MAPKKEGNVVFSVRDPNNRSVLQLTPSSSMENTFLGLIQSLHMLRSLELS
jgi:hypothetical protein